MKLLSAHILNFGALSDVSFSFGEGLNILCRENGFGKSTLVGFIKAMLYGFFDTKKQSLSENDRKKYLPWGGGICGGSLTFSIGTERYRIERTFGQRPHDDTLRVFDEKSGLLSTRFGAFVGEELLDIDAEGFLRTLCLSERIFEGAVANESITDRLCSLVGSVGDVTGIQRAYAILEKQTKQLYKRGGRGELSLLSEQIARQNDAVLTLRREKEELTILRRDVCARENELDGLRQELQKRESELSRGARTEEQLAAERTRTEERLIQVRSQLRALNDALGDDPPSQADIDEMQRDEGRLEMLRGEADAELHDKSHFDETSSPEELQKQRKIYKNLSLEEQRAKIKEFRSAHPYLTGSTVSVGDTLRRMKKRQRAVRLRGVSLLFALLGVLCALLAISHLGALWIGALLCLVASVCLTLLFPVPKIKREQRRELLQIIRCAPRMPTDALAHLLDENQEISRLEEKCRTDGENIDALYAVLKKKIDAFYRRYHTFGTPPYRALREALYRREVLLREEKELTERLCAADAPREDLSEAQDQQLGQLRERIRECELSVARGKEQVCRIELRVSALEECEAKLIELCQKRARFEERLDVLNRTREQLMLAEEGMKTSYLAFTRERFLSILGELSGEDTDGFTLDSAFGISRTERGLTHPSEAYSRGENDLYQLAMRLSLADAMYQNGVCPPLILDDPFLTFDDARAERAMAYLKRVGQKRQIIYLTCSKARGGVPSDLI